VETGPDTFGAVLLAAFEGGSGRHAVERDDGLLDRADAGEYLSPPETWRDGTVDALGALSGRVLDVGAGGGRHAVYLRDAGCEVTALDPSPGAVEVCRRRGLTAFEGALGDPDLLTGEQFDAVALLGNNLALLAGPEQAPGHLAWLAERCRPGAMLVGEGLDATRDTSLEHIVYQRRARREGRVPGQMRLRVVYEDRAGDWFDYWQLSPDALREAVESTPWTVEQVTGEMLYVATLRLCSGSA
jgi:SAM-dependent methyltransferase